jgi:hypothetical protein
MRHKIAAALLVMGLSFVSVGHAAIIDNGDFTTDTDTGLDWLDLTKTSNRSYDDISSKLGVGQEFEGWRYATQAEVQTLWKNMGVTNGTNIPIDVSDTVQYEAFIDAVNLLGNTFNEHSDEVYDYGAAGLTGDLRNSCCPLLNGMYHNRSSTQTAVYSVNNTSVYKYTTQPFLGSYLVSTTLVPIPAAAWLFGSGLIGLVGMQRRQRS